MVEQNQSSRKLQPYYTSGLYGDIFFLAARPKELGLDLVVDRDEIQFSSLGVVLFVEVFYL